MAVFQKYLVDVKILIAQNVRMVTFTGHTESFLETDVKDVAHMDIQRILKPTVVRVCQYFPIDGYKY